MKRPSIPMTWEEYESLERPFGWKVEYWDGHTHLTPRSMGVTAHLNLTTYDSLEPIERHGNHQYTLATVEANYADQMIAGYLEAFADSVEFCNWPVEKIQESAERDISHYFSGKRGDPLPASVIALEPDTQKLIGLALFVLGEENRPHLQLLYVRSPFQRQGIATDMLNHGINHLRKADFQELSSAYHICNDISRQWHHQLGFQDVHDWYYLRLKVGWVNNEIWRREKLGMNAGLDELRQQQDDYQAQLDEKEREKFG